MRRSTNPLVEAAPQLEPLDAALARQTYLDGATSIGQTDWGQGIYARCRALLSDGQDAEGWYRQAVGRLSRTGFRPELARAYLLYGEWLRREGRRADARAQLGTVEWHLRKVFTKLEISSRLQLQQALPDGASAAPTA